MNSKRKEDDFDFEASRICVVCSNMFKGRYCNVCGEKVTEKYEKSFLHFADSLLNAFTFLDGKFLLSTKLLIAKPGQLSRNIADGRRVPFMKMISLFFVANFFYFLFPAWDSFNSSLYSQMNTLGPHSEVATRMVQQRLEKDKISMEEFKATYESQSTNLSKLFIILLAIVFAFTLAIINYSKENYFFDHLTFALEFYSFHIIVNVLLLSWIAIGLVRLAAVVGLDWSVVVRDQVFTVGVVALMAYFLARGLRTFYHQKWYWSIPKTAILLYLLYYTLHVYRVGLFYVTLSLI